MELCSEAAKPRTSFFTTCSINSASWRKSPPAPPYSSGIARQSRPAAPASRQKPRSTTPASSHRRTLSCGACSSKKRAAAAWKMTSSSSFRKSARSMSSAVIRSSRFCNARLCVDREMPVEALAQFGLQQLSGGRVRQAVDEYDVVGHLPFRQFVRKKFQNRLPGRRAAFARMNDQERPLLPDGMRDGYDGRLVDVGMLEGEVLDLDRRDPLSSGLDHIF